MPRNEVRGPGWVLYEIADAIVLRFSSKPDDGTLLKLRAFMRWDPDHRVWECPIDMDLRERALAIAHDAQTWESVGEDPPFWDSYDSPESW